MSLIRQAFLKIQRQALLSKQIEKGLKILKRINNQKSTAKLMRSWFSWKFYCQSTRDLNNQSSDEGSLFSTLNLIAFDHLKRSIINSSQCRQASKDFQNIHSNQLDLSDSSSFTLASKIPDEKLTSETHKQNSFNNYIKDHHISDRDLVVSESYIQAQIKSNFEGFQLCSLLLCSIHFLLFTLQLFDFYYEFIFCASEI